MERGTGVKTAGKVAIVGVSGRMGAMLKIRLERAGCRVAGADRPLRPDALSAACAGASAVFLCVPAAAMEEVTALVAPHLEPGAALVDIASVKMLPMGIMERLYDGPVVGTHPLFGPNPKPDDRAVCVTPGRPPDGAGGEVQAEEAVRLVEGLFQSMGCTTFRSTPEVHDRAMASIQGLNFITSVAYFAMLSRHEDVLPFITPSFQRRLEASRSLLTEDAELFSGIFAANPMSQDVVREYRSYLNLAAGGDVDMLVALASWWFDPARLSGHDG